MRSRIFATIIVGFLLAACTPTQVREVLRQNHIPTTPQVVQKIVRATTPTTVIGTATSTFLQDAARLHNEPFLVCTRAHESDTAGGYQAFNGSGPYYGAYQFLQSTWDTTAHHSGQHWLAGARITQVIGFWQDYLAWDLYKWQGKGPWGYRC